MTKEEMTQLRNTLNLVEVKGQSVIYIADCIRFLEQKISQADAPADK